jgi:uncharacterized membrane protein YccC
MADLDPAGRPIPTLLIVLWGSFVLMVLSGVFFALGLPNDWARALFFATVVIWIVLGVALVVQGRLEVRSLQRAAGATDGGAEAGPQIEGGSDEGE